MPMQHPPSACYCDCVCSWSLTSLIGSYLDLALAYLLLIGSTLAFFASKFLSVFGLALPCPCDALFAHPHCVQSRIGSIHSSIRTRFPIDHIGNNAVAHIGSRAEGDGCRDHDVAIDGIHGSIIGNRLPPVNAVTKIRKRRKRGKLLSISSSAPPPLRLSWHGEGLAGDFDNGSRSNECAGAEMVDVSEHVPSPRLVDEASQDDECHAAYDESSAIDVHSVTRGTLEVIVKNLERELEEARASHAALYVELEKERSAAASAADEAMAMILRLQNEKANVEMESRQYQRMIEEKSAYDEEEMDILKEIIVRREREKHVLEEELEAYRRTMVPGERAGNKPGSLFDLSDDPTMMLKSIYESIGKKEKLNDKMKRGISFPELPDPAEESSSEVQEKGMVAAQVYPSGQLEHGFRKELSSLISEEDGEGESRVEMRSPADEFGRMDQDINQKSTNQSLFETDSHVVDVHVVDDKYNLGFQKDAEGTDISEVGCAQGISSGTSKVDAPANANTPVSSGFEGEQIIKRSFSDTTEGSQSIDILSNSASHSDLQRTLMSEVDSERLKLETEVEILRKRLNTIHQGRESLSFPFEYKEKETVQLQLLEEIACQLQEIRKLTEPGNKMRRASLPPVSSKVTSKKKRSRSVSCGFHDSA